MGKMERVNTVYLDSAMTNGIRFYRYLKHVNLEMEGESFRSIQGCRRQGM